MARKLSIKDEDIKIGINPGRGTYEEPKVAFSCKHLPEESMK